MSYYTRDQLVTMLADVSAAIARTLQAQSYSIGSSSKQNPVLTALYDREKWIITQIDQIDATSTSAGAVGGMSNKVTFQRPG